MFFGVVFVVLLMSDSLLVSAKKKWNSAEKRPAIKVEKYHTPVGRVCWDSSDCHKGEVCVGRVFNSPIQPDKWGECKTQHN